MDKEHYEYISTKLKNLFFKSDMYENEMEFSLKITHSIQDIDNDEKYKSIIKIEGDLEAKNLANEIVTSISMESHFKSSNLLKHEELEDSDYFNQPIINELTVLLGLITGKAFSVPIVIPMSSSSIEDNE